MPGVAMAKLFDEVVVVAQVLGRVGVEVDVVDESDDGGEVPGQAVQEVGEDFVTVCCSQPTGLPQMTRQDSLGRCHRWTAQELREDWRALQQP